LYKKLIFIQHLIDTVGYEAHPMHKWDESIAIKYFVRDTISNHVTLHKKQKLKGNSRYLLVFCIILRETSYIKPWKKILVSSYHLINILLHLKKYVCTLKFITGFVPLWIPGMYTQIIYAHKSRSIKIYTASWN